MLRILLIISLIFSLSLFSGMGHLYAKCRPGHDDGGGGSASSPSGEGGGMSGAAGAAAAFGLLFNLLQSTRAQEDDADAVVDIDALAAEYTMAFNVIDPTVSLIVLAGGLTGVDIAAAPPGAAPGCSCGGDKCTCPKKDACDVVCGDVSGGGGGVSVATAPPEDTPGCSCNAVGNNCVCPEAFACGGATHVVQWDGESGGVLSAEWVCGGATLVDTGGVSIAEPPPEDPPVCACGGGNCKCPEEDACVVQLIRDLLKVWSGRIMDAPPGSEEARDAMRELNYSMKWLEEAEKRCK